MPDLDRRFFLQWPLSGLAALSLPMPGQTRERVPARADSPLVGTDPVFISSGLTARWQSAMRQDLGWAARWQAMDTVTVLDQLEQGQVDAGLFLSHPQADHLDKQGLIYNRQTLARTDVLLLGPADDVAGIKGETDPGRALAQILAAQSAGAALWLPPSAGSALAALADQLTQGLASKGLLAAGAGKAKATTPAYRLMTRAQWLKAPPAGERLKVWIGDHPKMVLEAQVACSFRVRHPGAKLLVSWLQWPLAQSAVKASGPGWRPAKG
jgi:hypothetical protein